MQNITIAIIANDQTTRQNMRQQLSSCEYGILEYDYRMAGGIAGFRGVYVVCMGITDDEGLQVLQRWSAEDRELPIIVYGAEHIAERALQNGAYDVVPMHAPSERLLREVRHAIEKRRLTDIVDQLRSELTARDHGEGDMVVPLRELEHRAIARALQATQGSVTKAAKLLGIGRATLYRRLASPEFASLRPRRSLGFASVPMQASL
jgi:DNA-binding NtrC family response regulator